MTSLSSTTIETSAPWQGYRSSVSGRFASDDPPARGRGGSAASRWQAPASGRLWQAMLNIGGRVVVILAAISSGVFGLFHHLHESVSSSCRRSTARNRGVDQHERGARGQDPGSLTA